MSSPSVQRRHRPSIPGVRFRQVRVGVGHTTRGPIIDAIDQMSPIAPWYAPRSRSGTRSARMISVNASITPEPNPCTAACTTNKHSGVSSLSLCAEMDGYLLRPAMSMPILLAAPHSALPTAKSARPMSKIGRRPNKLAKCPESGRNATPARVYAEPIHTNCWPWKWLMIVGRAVDTALCEAW